MILGGFGLQCLSTKTEISEASEVFVRRKRVQYVWIDTRAVSERERVADIMAD